MELTNVCFLFSFVSFGIFGVKLSMICKFSLFKEPIWSNVKNLALNAQICEKLDKST